MNDIPNKGDLVWLNLSPRSGHEQSGHRPALVVSPKIYHEKSNLAVICPITSNTDAWPWKVMLPTDAPVQGAILTDQIRSIDRGARKLKIIGSVHYQILQDVLAKMTTLLATS